MGARLVWGGPSPRCISFQKTSGHGLLQPGWEDGAPMIWPERSQAGLLSAVDVRGPHGLKAQGHFQFCPSEAKTRHTSRLLAWSLWCEMLQGLSSPQVPHRVHVCADHVLQAAPGGSALVGAAHKSGDAS